MGLPGGISAASAAAAGSRFAAAWALLVLEVEIFDSLTTTMPAIELKSFYAPDGKSRIQIQQVGDGGRFRFQEHLFLTEYGRSFWVPGYSSGYYDSAEAAELAAKQQATWLCDQISA
jgi:hypothetical protein